MAITNIDYLFWKDLRACGELPPNPDVLELGQANWYGDRDPACLEAEVRHHASPKDVEMLLDVLKQPPDADIPFRHAEVFYTAILRYCRITSIDWHGTARAIKLDLNRPLCDPESIYPARDIVINTGTAEHIFNQAQFFRTCHEACKTGGLMVHTLPAWGWIDHGFYNYHPTFIADLAAANGYEIVKWWLYELGEGFELIREPADAVAYLKNYGTTGSFLHDVCFRKITDHPFQLPMQGFYAGTLDDARKEAWHNLR